MIGSANDTVGGDIQEMFKSCQNLLSHLRANDMIEESFDKQFQYATIVIAYNLYANQIFINVED